MRTRCKCIISNLQGIRDCFQRRNAGTFEHPVKNFVRKNALGARLRSPVRRRMERTVLISRTCILQMESRCYDSYPQNISDAQ